MPDALAVISAIVALEACRLAWHGRLSGSWPLVGAHAALAGWLGWQGAGALCWLDVEVPAWLPVGLAMLAAASVLASRLALDSKRRGEALGSLLSGLSSHPWELLALASLGWWGLPAAVLAGWLSLGVWMSPLRPAHWTASRWAKRLGWMHPWW